jgi:hypothetical protein
MTTAQVEYSAEELLTSHDFAEPLVAGGRRCHGGFDETGAYRSPRTRFRAPAIEAWEQQRSAQFGTPIVDVPMENWPESFPNVEQSKFLISKGVIDPIVATLTRIGTVEGFGGMLRLLPIPDFQRVFDEDVRGTAIAHLDRGLFEAHARDEAGFEDEGGHDTMWFIARDIAFDNPVTEDQTALMLERMGIAPPGAAGRPDLGKLRETMASTRALPDDIDLTVEMVVNRMIGLLFIEIAAFHSFRWAEAVLSDTEMVAGDGEAARIVSYIRADETPHVSYLRTTLSEMRDRTWVGQSGRKFSGQEMIGRLWDRALEESTVLRRGDQINLSYREILRAVDGRADRDDLLDELFSMGSVRRLPDGTVVDPGDPRYADVSTN